VPFPVERRMSTRINAEVAKHPVMLDGTPYVGSASGLYWCYAWARTPAGNAARVRFCKRQVARLTRVRKIVPKKKGRQR
jgi:hypothetical protein